MGEVNVFLDYYYFSTVTYVSLGYGDIIPKGYIRIMSSIQGVTGLILIGCSVSLIFLFMERYWRQDPQHSSQRHWQKASVSLAEVRKNK